MSAASNPAKIYSRQIRVRGLEVESQPSQITSLLSAAAAGDAAARDQLWRLDEIQRIARSLLARERRAADLQTTVLINEACLKIAAGDGDALQCFANRRHFFSAVANAMRQFLVENARKRRRLKRGGGAEPLSLADVADPAGDDPATTLAIHEALEELQRLEPLQAEIVALRHYTGLTMQEIADVTGVCKRTVDKQWAFARVWIRARLS